MNAMVALLVPALLGVDFGWDRRADGTIEYIVQVDPDAFAEMTRSGQSISSALPSSLRNKVSDVQFRVGRDKLPNQNTLPPDMPGGDLLNTLSSVASPTGGVTLPTAPPDPFKTTSPGTTTATNGAPVPTPTPGYMTSGYQPTAISAPPTGGSSFSPNTNAGTAGNGAWPTGGSPLPPSVPSSSFPTNPTASPPGATGGLGPPTVTSYGGATPPSLSTGPRIAQPQPWPTTQRDPQYANRLPVDMTAANPTPSNGPAIGNPGYGNSNYAPNPPTNNGGVYGQPGYQQPNYQQPGYSQPGTQQTMYATAGPQPGNMQPGGQMQPGTMPAGGTVNTVGNHDPYYNRPVEPRSASNAGMGAPITAPQAEAQWVPLTLCLIGFLTSLASNFYFGWSTYQLRERYRLLLVDRGAY